MNTNELNKYAKVLKDFFMGEFIPQSDSIRGMYDSEAWEAIDWSSHFAKTHCVVECVVEPAKEDYLGEGYWVDKTEYCPETHKFYRNREFWPMCVVKNMKNEIVIEM